LDWNILKNASSRMYRHLLGDARCDLNLT